MDEQNKGVFQQAQKKREELNLPIMSFQVADSWIDYLGYEPFGWWLKFHSWVDRSDTRYLENHVPRTLENVFEELKVSQTTFYRKIKVLWECGLVEIVEYGKSERKSQKPKNILVYEYPFHEIGRKYKPLEKLRDWKKDYDSQSKIAGIKGALSKKESTNKQHPPNSERVENSVDNSDEIVDKYPANSERVHPANSERVTLPNLGGNNYTNNLLTKQKDNNYTNNNSLSHDKIDLIQDILTAFNFTEREKTQVIELLNKREIFDFSKQDIIDQARSMVNKPEIRVRAVWFVNGLEANLGRKPVKIKTPEQPKSTKPVFYNWLEE